MAAFAALVSLTNIVHDIQHHRSPPISIDAQHIRSLTQILASLHEYLEASKSDQADPLEMRIAAAAYAAEDVIESHLMDTIQPSPNYHPQMTSDVVPKTSCCFSCFRASKKLENADNEQAKGLKFYEDLQRVIEEMGLITQMAKDMETEKDVAVHAHDVSAPTAPLRSSSLSSSAMVCSAAVLDGLMNKLTEDRGALQVIPIVGMGGIGKTTLARTIYKRQLIQDYFDVRAWITVSQKYNTRELLDEVLVQVTQKERKEVREKSEDKVGLELYQYLFGRRFLVVMDDMWNIDAWEKIECYVPDNSEGSRILVTTRLSQLGSQLNDNYRLQMDFLDEEQSWDLFSKTVFGEESCPPELMEIGKKIVENCRGLPLSIVVVGGLLKRTGLTQKSWESKRDNLTSTVNLEDDKHCLRLLKLSYNHLPLYLKPCFLYMGVFEEDDEIKASTIIKLWVSEGFLKPVDERSTETIAMEFLEDLVGRNLIMIDKLGSTGKIKTCKIHDLFRDLCLNEGQNDGFFHVIGKSGGRKKQCRRVVIPWNTPKKKVIEVLQSTPYARSVICENGQVPECRNSGLFRTFHAYKFHTIDGRIYRNPLAVQYVNLRHLAVKVDSMSTFFSKLDLFWNLQTIIVSCPSTPESSAAPAEIWKMPHLRHVEFPDERVCLPLPPSDKEEKVVVMENLQTLKGIRSFKCSEDVIKRIPNLKKLKTQYFFPLALEDIFHEDCYCVGNIQYLCKLESLHISCDRMSGEAHYLKILSFPQSLKSLTLEMNIEFEWEEILKKIGSLPHLEKLRLWVGCFGSGKWEMEEKQFPALKYLGLFSIPSWKEWRIQGLPRLEQLRLFHIEELEEIPSEIGEIPTLQKIWVWACSEAVVKSAKAMVEEREEQGDLSFQVEVWLYGRNPQLKSLAAPPSFIVR